jgi:uncharacterized protein YfiM (DUF2279 family)
MYCEQLKVGLMNINEIPLAPFKRGNQVALVKSFLSVSWKFRILRVNSIAGVKPLLSIYWIFPFLRMNFTALVSSFLSVYRRFSLLRMSSIAGVKPLLSIYWVFPFLRMNFTALVILFSSIYRRFSLLRKSSIAGVKPLLSIYWIFPFLRMNFTALVVLFSSIYRRFSLLRKSSVAGVKPLLSIYWVFPFLRMNFIALVSSFSSIPFRFPLLRGLGGLTLLLFFFTNSFSQQDTIHPKRLKMVVAAEAIGYGGSMAGVYGLWYKDVPYSSFHTFNDNAEWLQMDKIGHGVTSYYVGMAGYHALKWSGVNNKKSILLGGSLGLFFLTSVEIYDGYSSDWGFSWGDVAFNTLGAGFFIGQQFMWNEQRILLKYSYHQSNYVAQNPRLLGENFAQNVLKDYNGQTYWASINIASFLGDNNQFPKWLNLAVGYGADGMIGAFDNPTYSLAERERQYYLSLDIDLTRIKTKSKLANTVLGAFGFIKFPMPTVEFNQKSGFKFYPIYF